MGLLGDTKGFVFGFAIGFGSGLITRNLIREPRATAGPVLKVMMRAGIRLSERTRELSSQLGEILQDTVAEVRESLKQERTRAKAKPAARKRRRPEQGNVINLKPQGSA